MKLGWVRKSLGTICHVYQPETLSLKDLVDGPFPVFGANGQIGWHSDFNHDDEELVIGCRGSVGFVHLTPAKTWINGNAMVVKSGDEIERDYLAYALRGGIDLTPAISGAAQPQITRQSLSPIQLSYPVSKAEQRRIVDILDEAFTGIATAKADAEKNLQNSRDALESYLESIFSVRLSGWSDRKLEAVCTEITVGYVGPMKNEYVADGVPFLRSQNVRPFEISLENLVFISPDFNRRIAKSRLVPGDIAIVRTGYPGTAAVIPDDLPEANCSDLVIMRPGQNVDPHFLVAFFNSAFGKSIVLGNLVGAAQKHFNVGSAKNVNLHMPPMPEQRQIVGRIDEVRAEVARLESLYTRKLAALEELKKSLLQQAFSGQL